MRSRLFGVGLAVAALAGAATAGASEAGNPGLAAASHRAVEASAAFAALAADSGAPDAVAPRAADPAVAVLLDAVFDTAPVSAAHMDDLEDLKAIDAWLKASLETGKVYVLAGTGGTYAQAPDDPAIAAQVDRNTARYAPEIGRWFDATAALEGGLLDAVAAVKATRPSNAQTRAGEEMIGRGLVNTLEGEIRTLPTAGLDDGWRAARLPALVALAGKARGVLQPAQCAAVRDTAAEVRPALTGAEVRAKLDAVAAALRC